MSEYSILIPICLTILLIILIIRRLPSGKEYKEYNDITRKNNGILGDW